VARGPYKKTEKHLKKILIGIALSLPYTAKSSYYSERLRRRIKEGYVSFNCKNGTSTTGGLFKNEKLSMMPSLLYTEKVIIYQHIIQQAPELLNIYASSISEKFWF
jgi:hypothetical protein